MQTERPFTGVRILDLTHRYGRYATRLFADLGAEVIRVEPPEGLPDRRSDAPGGSRADRFDFLNASKASIVLDLAAPEGRVAFDSLAASASMIFLERDGPLFGELATIARTAPAAVVVAVSPYGLGGPWSEAPASDLTLQSAGGIAWMSGRMGEPPLRLPGEQAEMVGSVYAATVAAICLLHAEATGTGHVVDVSVQEAIAHSLQNAVQVWDLERRVSVRGGEGTRDATEDIFHCRDGYVFLAAPPALGVSWRALLAFMEERGHAPTARLREDRWMDLSFRTTREAKAIFREVFEGFTAGLTKQEITDEAIARKIVLGPVARICELVDDEQLRHRDFFRELASPDGGTIVFPGAPYAFSKEVWEVRPAPRLGEHTELYRHEWTPPVSQRTRSLPA